MQRNTEESKYISNALCSVHGKECNTLSQDKAVWSPVLILNGKSWASQKRMCSSCVRIKYYSYNEFGKIASACYVYVMTKYRTKSVWERVSMKLCVDETYITFVMCRRTTKGRRQVCAVYSISEDVVGVEYWWMYKNGKNMLNKKFLATFFTILFGGYPHRYTHMIFLAPFLSMYALDYLREISHH